MTTNGSFRLYPVRLRRPHVYGEDAGPLVVEPGERLVQPGRAGYPREGDAAIPYPRSAPGPLTRRAATARIPALEGRARQVARNALAVCRWLVWLVPALIVAGPPGGAGLVVAAGLALAGSLLRYAARLVGLARDRDRAVAAHGRVWDRILSHASRSSHEPPERIDTAVTQSLAAILADDDMAEHILGPACAMTAALAGTAVVSQAAGAGLLTACMVFLGLAALTTSRSVLTGRHASQSAAAMRREADVFGGNLPRLRDLAMAAEDGRRLTALQEAALASAARSMRAREDKSGLGHAAPVMGAVTALGLAAGGGLDPLGFLLLLTLAPVAATAAIALGTALAEHHAASDAIAGTGALLAGAVPAGRVLSGQIRSIRLRGVTHRHHRDGAPVLRGVDLDVTSGAAVALSGPSGAGKSTLLRILMGLVEPSEGTVTVDGIPVADAADCYRARIAAVLQDEDIGYAKVHSAVAAGRPGTGLVAVRQALADVGVLEEVEALPMKLQTLIVAGAFPKGIVNRLMIARCLAAEADLIILDEALSPLSRDAAAIILASARRRGAAIVFSAHRPDLVALADSVLALGPDQSDASGATSLIQ